MELDAIAAAILGGTSTLGGEGTVPGAIKGLVLVFAVWLDIMSRKKA